MEGTVTDAVTKILSLFENPRSHLKYDFFLLQKYVSNIPYACYIFVTIFSTKPSNSEQLPVVWQIDMYIV